MNNIILKEYTLLTKPENINLLNIRNNKNIRNTSLDNNIIDLEEHIAWIHSLKQSSNKKYFAVILDKKIIGGINIFNINANLKWGIFFHSSTNIVVKSIIPIYFLDLIFKKYPFINIHSEVVQTNHNAILLNKNLGFKKIEINNDIILLSLDNNSFMKKKKGFILRSIIKKMNLFTIKLEGFI